jgi:hypothetical protein
MDNFENSGVEILHRGENYFYGRDEYLHYLYNTDNSLSIGLVSTFDRWANSRDFVMYNVSIRNVNVADLRDYVRYRIKRGDYDSRWGRSATITLRDIKQFARRKKKEENNAT